MLLKQYRAVLRNYKIKLSTSINVAKSCIYLLDLSPTIRTVQQIP